MKKINDIECSSLPAEVTTSFDSFLEEECADRGILGSCVRDVTSEYFFGESNLQFCLAARIDFCDAENGQTDEILCIWDDGTWLIIDEEYETSMKNDDDIDEILARR